MTLLGRTSYIIWWNTKLL